MDVLLRSAHREMDILLIKGGILAVGLMLLAVALVFTGVMLWKGKYDYLLASYGSAFLLLSLFIGGFSFWLIVGFVVLVMATAGLSTWQESRNRGSDNRPTKRKEEELHQARAHATPGVGAAQHAPSPLQSAPPKLEYSVLTSMDAFRSVVEGALEAYRPTVKYHNATDSRYDIPTSKGLCMMLIGRKDGQCWIAYASLTFTTSSRSGDKAMATLQKHKTLYSSWNWAWHGDSECRVPMLTVTFPANLPDHAVLHQIRQSLALFIEAEDSFTR